jgi:hypothetical protein
VPRLSHALPPFWRGIGSSGSWSDTGRGCGRSARRRNVSAHFPRISRFRSDDLGGGGGGGGGDKPGPGPSVKAIRPEVEEPDGDGDIAEKESERVFQVGIVRENDKALDGALCRATIQSSTRACDVYVSVNSDHAVVQEALRSRPPKRDLLNLLIVDEIGRAVNEDVIKKLFHPKLAGDICDIQDQIQRSRVIARRLVDRVIVKDEAA